MATNSELERQVNALRAELETVKQSTSAAEVEALKTQVVMLERALDEFFGRLLTVSDRRIWGQVKREVGLTHLPDMPEQNISTLPQESAIDRYIRTAPSVEEIEARKEEHKRKIEERQTALVEAKKNVLIVKEEAASRVEEAESKLREVQNLQI